MLYVPGRFLFIHIPRSAGNSITRALAAELVAHSDVMVALHHGPACVWRHINCEQFRSNMQLSHAALQKIHVVAVQRDPEEIIRSDYELYRSINREIPNEYVDYAYYQKLKAARRGDFPQFREWWLHMLGGKTIVDWWVPERFNPILIDYDNIDEEWPAICDLAGCRIVPKLKRRDWQREWVSNG